MVFILGLLCNIKEIAYLLWCKILEGNKGFTAQIHNAPRFKQISAL